MIGAVVGVACAPG